MPDTVEMHNTDQANHEHNIAVLLYHLVDELELISIYNTIKQNLSDDGNINCYILAKSRNSVHSKNGVVITPDWGFMSAPECHTLIIPGGLVDDYAMRDKVMLEYFKRLEQSSLQTIVACSEGVLLLGAAEMLYNLNATTSRKELERLHEYEVADVVEVGIVQNDLSVPNIWCASGELVGLDVGESVLEHIASSKI